MDRSLENVIPPFVKGLGDMVSPSSFDRLLPLGLKPSGRSLSRQGREINFLHFLKGNIRHLDSCFRRNDVKRATRWVAPTSFDKRMLQEKDQNVKLAQAVDYGGGLLNGFVDEAHA